MLIILFGQFTAPETLQPLIEAPMGKSTRSTTKVMPLSTTASTLVPLVVRVKRKEAEDHSRSLLDEATYFSVLDNIEGLRLPSLGDINNDGESVFECPLCWSLCNDGTQRVWKRHVYADLKPYVCCFGEGECDDLLFHDRSSWFDHELQCHRRQWVCIMCQEGPYKTAEILEHHLQVAHRNLPLDIRG